MRRNNFSSAADRRWQRRYERIQQRKEEERERRERSGAEEYYEAFYPSYHDLDIQSVIQSAPTVTVTVPTFDRPNRNGTVITREAWENAMAEYSEPTTDEIQRVVETFNGLGNVHAVPPDSIDTMMLHHRLQAEQAERDRRAVRAIFDQYFETPSIDEVEDYYGAFVERRPTLYEQLEELLNRLNSRPAEPDPEPDLDAGDDSALDSFLGEFLALGA